MSAVEICPAGAVVLLDKVHADEFPSGPQYDLYAQLATMPLDGVWAMEASELTVERNRATGRNDRYTTVNMQWAETEEAKEKYPDGYEVRRRPEIRAAIAPAKVVLETHSNLPQVSYCYYDRTASPLVRGIASALGIRHAVYMSEFFIGYGQPDHLVLDFADSFKEEYVPVMYDLLAKLGIGWEPVPESGSSPIQEYEFVDDISVKDARKWSMPAEWESFTPFNSEDDAKLVRAGLPAGTVSVGWSDKHTEWIGELALPITSV